MSKLQGVVRQMAVGIEGATVTIELICADAYGAMVLNDDIVSRLKSDGALSLSLRAGAVLEETPE